MSIGESGCRRVAPVLRCWDRRGLQRPRVRHAGPRPRHQPLPASLRGWSDAGLLRPRAPIWQRSRGHAGLRPRRQPLPASLRGWCDGGLRQPRAHICERPGRDAGRRTRPQPLPASLRGWASGGVCKGLAVALQPAPSGALLLAPTGPPSDVHLDRARPSERSMATVDLAVDHK